MIKKVSGIFVHSEWTIKNETKKAIAFITVSKSLKYLIINLTKEVWALYTEN